VESAPVKDLRRPCIAVIALALWLGSGSVAEAQKPIRIGASASRTGTYAALGQNQLRGYELCVQRANEKGGLLGRKLELIVEDDQSQPAIAVSIYERLITQEKVDLVLGPYGSPMTAPVSDVTKKYGMPMVAPTLGTTSVVKEGRGYIFQVYSPSEIYLEGFVELVVRHGLKTLVLIDEDSLFPQAAVKGALELARKRGLRVVLTEAYPRDVPKAMAHGTVELARKRGFQVVLTEAYPKGTTDFSGILGRAKAANPDVLVAGTYFDDAVAITRQLKEADVNPKMVVYDDGSDPATAVRLYEKLITQDKVDLLLGPYSSDISEAVADVSEQHRMPMVAPVGAATSIYRKGRKFIFGMLPSAETRLEGLIDLAARKGLKSVAVINVDDLARRAGAQGTIELARTKGLQVVFAEAYPLRTTDYSAILTRVRPANPDVLVGSTRFDDAVAVTRQMKALNVNPREFVDSYKQEFPGADFSYHAAAGYGGCEILVEAIRRAGSLDRDKLREAILGIDRSTVFGGFRVDRSGARIGHKALLFQWQDGQKVIVWPEDLAPGQSRFPTPPWSQRQ
jgi:branched-chain amino acid transport system substrate-binding protein